jgi:UDP-glucose 4-epimerase
MKVCITGAAGFLGSYIACHFYENGDEVVAIDNLIGGTLANWPDTIVADCADVELMKSLCRGVDVIYHCACTAYEGLSVFSPTVVSQNTLTITASMLAAAAHNKVKRFVHCSSMARYGAQKAPFTEDMPCAPEDPYGIAKAAAENLVRVMAATHGFEHVIAIPHNIYGPGQKYNDPYRNVVAIWFNRLLQGKPPVIYGDGEQTRCLSYISDVLDVLLQLATVEGVDGEVFNVGPDGDTLTISQLCDWAMTAAETRIDPVYMDARPREVRDATCSSEKIRRWFDFHPRVPLATGLFRLWAHIKASGPKPFDYNLPLEFTTAKTPRTWTDRLF